MARSGFRTLSQNVDLNESLVSPIAETTEVSKFKDPLKINLCGVSKRKSRRPITTSAKAYAFDPNPVNRLYEIHPSIADWDEFMSTRTGAHLLPLSTSDNNLFEAIRARKLGLHMTAILLEI
jgi:hypothetical protein